MLGSGRAGTASVFSGSSCLTQLLAYHGTSDGSIAVVAADACFQACAPSLHKFLEVSEFCVRNRRACPTWLPASWVGVHRYAAKSGGKVQVLSRRVRRPGLGSPLPHLHQGCAITLRFHPDGATGWAARAGSGFVHGACTVHAHDCTCGHSRGWPVTCCSCSL